MTAGERRQVSDPTGKRHFDQKWRKSVKNSRNGTEGMTELIRQALKAMCSAGFREFRERESTPIVEKPVDEWRTAQASA